jgi:hypothetical protein
VLLSGVVGKAEPVADVFSGVAAGELPVTEGRREVTEGAE